MPDMRVAPLGSVACEKQLLKIEMRNLRIAALKD
jgi:hypothetical protein